MRHRFGLALMAVWIDCVGAIDAQISGTWRGESTCAQKSACSDEIVVYRIARQEKGGIFSVSADKIVGGKAVNMGTLQFRYLDDQHVLMCEYSQGVWRLNIMGDKIDGTLTRPDGTLFRHVALRKDPQ